MDIDRPQSDSEVSFFAFVQRLDASEWRNQISHFMQHVHINLLISVLDERMIVERVRPES
jgi:hypothetical protein